MFKSDIKASRKYFIHLYDFQRLKQLIITRIDVKSTVKHAFVHCH